MVYCGRMSGLMKTKSENECFFLLMIFFVAALLLRYHGLTDESLWLDEVLSFEKARNLASIQMKHHIFLTSWNEPHPPFYFVLLRFWTWLFGTGEWALRSLSALIGSFIVVVVYVIGKTLISRKVGIIAAFLTSVNPVAVYYSQEGRMYSLIPLIMLLAIWAFFRMMRSHEMHISFVLYVLASILLLYTDYLGFLLFLPFWSYVLVCNGLFKNLKKVVLYGVSNGIILLLYIPWLFVVLDSVKWQQISWMPVPGLWEFAHVLGALLSGLQIDASSDVSISYIGSSSGSKAIFGMISLYGIFFFGVGAYRALKEKGSFLFLLALLSFVPVIIFLISALKTPIFNLRQAQLYLPVLIFLLAYGMATCSSFVAKESGEKLRKALLVIIVLPIAVSYLFGCFKVYSMKTKEDWRTIAVQLERMEPALPVYVWKSYMRKPFNYYYRGKGDVYGLDEEGLKQLGTICVNEKCVLIVSHGNARKALSSIERDFNVSGVTNYQGILVIILQKR